MRTRMWVAMRQRSPRRLTQRPKTVRQFRLQNQIRSLLSWSALLILFGAFVLVWGLAYAWHTLASPDGAVIFGILLAYRFQRHEQRARLDRLAAWEDYEDNEL